MGSSRGGRPQHCPGLGLKWTLLAAQFEGEKHSHGGLGFRNPACLSPLPFQQTSPPSPPPALSSISVLFAPDFAGLCCFTFDFLISVSLGLYLRSFKIQQTLSVKVGEIRYKLILDHVVNFYNKNFF